MTPHWVSTTTVLDTTTQNGRFWSTDTYEGNDRDPVSLHKYLSPVSFAVLLLSMSLVSILPIEGHGSTVAAVEWTEIVLGTSTAVVSLTAMIWSWKQASAPSPRTKVLVFVAAILWALFWLVTLTRPQQGG